jgi:hypothetical protein
LIAAPGSVGYICTSTNAGVAWITNNSVSSRAWWSVAISADGGTLAAVDGNGGFTGHIFTSTNFGTTWVSNNVPLLSWQNIALSADGTTLIAAGWNSSGIPTGPIFTSTDCGATWVSNNIPEQAWLGVTCSADGAKLMAVSAATNYLSSGFGNVLISQTTQTPCLKVKSDGNLQLSWLTPSTNFVLQESPDLAIESWSDVTNVPALNLTNLQEQVELPAAAGNGFFRLKTP